ncbi:MAG: GC-type dockerin domain-anchored protein [Phycisphaerales bacterium JB054]
MTARVLAAAVCAAIVTLSTAASAQVVQLARLLPDDGAAGGWFGHSVDIAEGTAIVGAWNPGDTDSVVGAAYLFDVMDGRQIAELLSDDGALGDQFGACVAINRTVALVGAAGNDANGTDAGAAYLFDIDGGAQLGRLVPNDLDAHDGFGVAVALNDTVAAVGAFGGPLFGEVTGAVYLFDLATGAQLAKLLPDDGMESRRFGVRIAMDDTRVLVGAIDAGGDGEGAAYLFDIATGEQLRTFTPDDGARGDEFGSVAIEGDTVLVGAERHWHARLADGAAYLFDAVTGAQTAKIVLDDPGFNDHFGFAVAVEGSTALITAHRRRVDDPVEGAAYLFDTSTGRLLATVLPDDGGENDNFGWAAAMDGRTAIISALLDGDNGEESGSAYLFDLRWCPVDLTGDNAVDTRDFLAFLGAWAARDESADWDENGVIDTRDVVAYLNAWVAGC